MTAPEPVAVLERRLAVARCWMPYFDRMAGQWAEQPSYRKEAEFYRQQVADLERLLAEAREREQ